MSTYLYFLADLNGELIKAILCLSFQWAEISLIDHKIMDKFFMKKAEKLINWYFEIELA